VNPLTGQSLDFKKTMVRFIKLTLIIVAVIFIISVMATTLIQAKFGNNGGYGC
jgi:hypothetical protein